MAIIDDIRQRHERPPTVADVVGRARPPGGDRAGARGAGPGDVVVIAGKGHETHADDRRPVVDFDDRRPCADERTAWRTGAHVIAIMLAGATAMIVSLFGTRWLIVFFRTRGQGQPILGKEDHGPEHHMVKQGTPTMGGIAIVVAALVGWLVAHIRPGLAFSDQAMIVWVGVLFMAFMGFLDDFIKVRKRHNRGIFWKQKNYLTMVASFGFAWWLVAAPASPRRSR